MNPVLSIITIVYNNVSDIERTICSIIDQDYKNIEYIVIDGNSSDGTKNIIEKYIDKIAKYISEPDNGIYDAMNKGLNLASGDYVLFMNSGDEIFDTTTVSAVFASHPNADIYYGETEMYDENWVSLGQRRHKAPKVFNWKSFKYGMNISHQAIYVKRTLAPQYDLNYKYSADIDWIIKIAKKSTSIVNVNRYVAKYLVGGISKKKHWASLKERYKILKHYYGSLPNLFYHGVIAFNLISYYLRHRKTND
ncbi:MAG: glycosyltransferase [Pedobacter sp.]|nr:MAG: glycosyltransferase [Pedobacter sp.]